MIFLAAPILCFSLYWLVVVVVEYVTDGAAARHAKPSHQDATSPTAAQRTTHPSPSASNGRSRPSVLGPAVRARLYVSVVDRPPAHLLYLKM